MTLRGFCDASLHVCLFAFRRVNNASLHVCLFALRRVNNASVHVCLFIIIHEEARKVYKRQGRVRAALPLPRCHASTAFARLSTIISWHAMLIQSARELYRSSQFRPTLSLRTLSLSLPLLLSVVCSGKNSAVSKFSSTLLSALWSGFFDFRFDSVHFIHDEARDILLVSFPLEETPSAERAGEFVTAAVLHLVQTITIVIEGWC